MRAQSRKSVDKCVDIQRVRLKGLRFARVGIAILSQDIIPSDDPRDALPGTVIGPVRNRVPEPDRLGIDQECYSCPYRPK